MTRKSVVFDPAVTAILGDGEKRDKARHQTRAQRKETARQEARVRVTLDVPEWLKDELLAVAEAEHTTASSVAAYLLAQGLRAVRAGEIELDKEPSSSPKYEYVVKVARGAK